MEPLTKKEVFLLIKRSLKSINMVLAWDLDSIPIVLMALKSKLANLELNRVIKIKTEKTFN